MQKSMATLVDYVALFSCFPADILPQGGGVGARSPAALIEIAFAPTLRRGSAPGRVSSVCEVMVGGRESQHNRGGVFLRMMLRSSFRFACAGPRNR